MIRQETIQEAAGLFDPHDGLAAADPEYVRGVLELTNRLIGRTADQLSDTRDEIEREARR